MTVDKGEDVSEFIAAPGWPTLRVHGPDAATWLNGIITCNVLTVAPGRGAWGSLLTKQGKVAADLQIVGDKTELFVGVSGGDAEAVLTTLDGYLVMEDAEVEAVDARWILSVPANSSAPISSAALALGTLPWGQVAPRATVVTAEVLVNVLGSSSSVLQQDEWEAWMVRRGIPRLGPDYSGTDNLHAASLERRTVDWSKGCYLGQEVVCMQDMRGKVKRRLVRLQADQGASLVAGSEVTTSSGEVVGKVTSVFQAVGIGSVVAPHFSPGTTLSAGGIQVIANPLLPD